MLKSPKAKGSSLERQFVEMIKDAGMDQYARRSIMSGAAFEKGDVKTILPFSFECKFYQKLAIYKFWEQALRDSSATKLPTLVLKANNKPILVCMEANDWLELLTYAIAGNYLKK